MLIFTHFDDFILLYFYIIFDLFLFFVLLFSEGIMRMWWSFQLINCTLKWIRFLSMMKRMYSLVRTYGGDIFCFVITCFVFQHTPVMYDNHRGYSIACHGPIPTIEGIPTSQILGCQELDFFAAWSDTLITKMSWSNIFKMC